MVVEEEEAECTRVKVNSAGDAVGLVDMVCDFLSLGEVEREGGGDLEKVAALSGEPEREKERSEEEEEVRVGCPTPAAAAAPE